MVVQCRFNSRRLPGKSMKILAGQPMLGFLLRRLMPCAVRPGIGLVLATTERPDDDLGAELAARLGVSVVRGAEDDVLARYLACLEEYPARHVIRVTADNPLTCPDMLAQCIDRIREICPDYLAVDGMPLGTAVDCFSAKALQQMGREASESDEREHINLHILRHPARYRCERIQASGPDVRLTVDTQEDFDFVAGLFPGTDPEPWNLPIKKIITRAERSWQPLSHWLPDIFGGKVPGKVAFRVDASARPGLSFGHVVRCLILARALRDQGCRSVFLMHAYEDGVEFVREHGVPVVIVDDLAAFGQTGPEAVRQGAQWLVTDLPYRNIDISGLEALNRSGLQVVFIDDARYFFPKVETVLNSTVRATGMETKAWRNAFLGPQFFIMDKRPKIDGGRKDDKKRVLLTFGGSDPTDLTVAVLRVLATCSWSNVMFTVVLGPGFQNSSEVLATSAGLPDCQIVHAPKSLLAQMTMHDVVICAGGRTMYEAWGLRKIFLPIASAPHEADEVRIFLKKRLTLYGQETFDGIELTRILEQILRSIEERNRR